MTNQEQEDKEPHELEKIQWNVIPIANYNGVLVERLVGGYRVFNQTCNTPDEVDLIIQNACSSLNESIVVKGGFSCVNDLKKEDD